MRENALKYQFANMPHISDIRRCQDQLAVVFKNAKEFFQKMLRIRDMLYHFDTGNGFDGFILIRQMTGIQIGAYGDHSALGRFPAGGFRYVAAINNGMIGPGNLLKIAGTRPGIQHDG